MASPPAKRRRVHSNESSLSYQLILEHVLTYPGTFDLIEDSMSIINRRPSRTRKSYELRSAHTAANGSPVFTGPLHTPSPNSEAAAQFITSLNDHISNSPSQSCSLPPVFISSFLRRCFTPELHLVDFPQALTGLDYLDDLNTRRKRDVVNAKRRLGVDEKKAGPNNATNTSPGLDRWLIEVENTERKAEALFTQLYVALRRWVLINELSLKPFNSHNALAMLNILYPPSRCVSASSSGVPAPTPPSAKLTPQVLGNQRAVFLSYVSAVENQGTSVLKPLMDQGKGPTDQDGWQNVAATLDQYLRVSMRAIEDAASASCRDDLELPIIGPQLQSAKQEGKRKPDSGYGSVAPQIPMSVLGRQSLSKGEIASGLREDGDQQDTRNDAKDASARNSAGSSLSGQVSSDRNKPLPSTPAGATIFASPLYAGGTGGAVRNFSRLEKIALEIRKIKSKRTPIDGTDEEEEEDKENTPTRAVDDHEIEVRNVRSHEKTVDDGRGRPSAMKRLRSFGDLKSYSRYRQRSKSRSRAATPQPVLDSNNQQHETFDADEMRRHRALAEARRGVAQ